MSSSELSNALNPYVVVNQPRRKQVPPVPQPRPAAPLAPPVASQPPVPHRSELELAFATVPPPQPVQYVVDGKPCVYVH